MLIAIRIILSLTALIVGFGIAGAVGSCMGQRNCESTLGTSLFWASLISAPFVISALTCNARRSLTSIINLICLAIIFAYVCFLFSSTSMPWNLISTLKIIAQWKSVNYLVFLAGILPSILIHTSLILMLCLAPKNITTITERIKNHNLPTNT